MHCTKTFVLMLQNVIDLTHAGHCILQHYRRALSLQLCSLKIDGNDAKLVNYKHLRLVINSEFEDGVHFHWTTWTGD
jgi:hypothetical protein